MYLGDEIGPEEAEALLREMAKRIWGYGMETAAIMFLETSKPLAYIGAQMGQALLLPLLNFAGEVPLERGDKYLRVVQSRDNLENLIKGDSSVFDGLSDGLKGIIMKAEELQGEPCPSETEDPAGDLRNEDIPF